MYRNSMNLIIFSVLFFLPSYGTLKDTLTSTLRQTCRAAEFTSALMVTHFGLALIHEGAHLAMAKIALNANVETVGKNWRFELEPFNSALCPTATYPIFKNESINALIAGIAPALGLASCYGVLKANNVFIEYQKENSFKNALIAGLKKDCLNQEQHRALQIAACAHTAFNAGHLIPFAMPSQHFESHGHQILTDIKRYLIQILLAVTSI